MDTKRIIIISASEHIREFFKLEALNFNLSVLCFEKIEKAHNDFSGYDLAIIDKDTVKQEPLNPAKIQLTVSKQSGKCDITYPISVFKLREIYNRLFSSTQTVQKIANNDFNKIIFYSNAKNTVSICQRKIVLSDTEYKILTVLCKNAQKIVLRESIRELFESGNGNITDVYICKLRKKLEEPNGQRLIFTVREKGYKIVTEAEWR